MYRIFLKKKTFSQKYGNKCSSRPFYTHSGGQQETQLYLRVALVGVPFVFFKDVENNQHNSLSLINYKTKGT